MRFTVAAVGVSLVSVKTLLSMVLSDVSWKSAPGGVEGDSLWKTKVNKVES